MSILQVKFYCTNCGTKRIYHAGEEVPRRCPQCQKDSKPKYARLRNKVPFLPELVSLGLLFSLGLYDLFVVRAKVLPWLPYVVGSVLFGVAWMLATLLLDWPKLPKGPHIVSEIKWSRQDSDPQELLGLRIVVTLEGRYPRKRFVSTIEGYKSILMDLEKVDDGWENDGVYILRPEQNPLEATHILFHPHWGAIQEGFSAQAKEGMQRRLQLQALYGGVASQPRRPVQRNLWDDLQNSESRYPQQASDSLVSPHCHDLFIW